MAIQYGVREMSVQQAQRFLLTVGAAFAKDNGRSKVYLARRENATITIHPGSHPGVVRVQTIAGCTC